MDPVMFVGMFGPFPSMVEMFATKKPIPLKVDEFFFDPLQVSFLPDYFIQ